MTAQKYHITLLKNNEIDKVKWDACIKNASNGLIYAYSFYLDALAQNWDAIIIDDYKAVMPLPWNKKLGIKYCYHPLLTQQLGLFITNAFDDYSALLTQIKKFTCYGDFFFNYANTSITEIITERANYIIDLKFRYDTIRSHYNNALINNLKKAQLLNLKYKEEENPDVAVELYEKYYKDRTAHLNKEDYRNYKKLSGYLLQNHLAFVRKICNEANETLALTFLLFDNRRLYNIINVITPEGKKTNANHLLLDNVIKEFSGQNLVLDLAGSEIVGVKFFYEKFGAINQPYFFYHHNELPFFIKLFKK